MKKRAKTGAPVMAGRAATAGKAGTARNAGKAGKRGTGAGEWRAAMLDRVRQMIAQADPEIVEEVKWRKPSNPAGVPVWSHNGIICTGETYKSAVKLTFMNGASLKDPARLFNASLDGNARRAIDLHEGDTLDEKAFKTLIRDAVSFNKSDA